MTMNTEETLTAESPSTFALPQGSQRQQGKTPLYAASHALRYGRQEKIKQIQDKTGFTLICYVSNEEVTRDDPVYFCDLLHNLPLGAPIDLLLHTPGGDVDAAEKIIKLLRSRVTEKGELRIIVPDFAKSAGTLIALAANQILMSDNSELGTIDPQYLARDSHGNHVSHSVLDYLSSFEHFKSKLRLSPDDPAFQMMLDKFNPALLSKYLQVEKRTRSLAEGLLRRRGLNPTRIAYDLMDTSKFPSHGQMIDWESAQQMGLSTVQYLPPTEALWQDYWSLFCQYRLALVQTPKIFESASASLAL